MKILAWHNKTRDAIYIRITIGHRAEISTGVKVSPNQWSASRQEIIGHSPEALIGNNAILKIKFWLNSYRIQHPCSTVQQIKEAYQAKELATISKDCPTIINAMDSKDRIYISCKKHLKTYCGGTPPRIDKLTQKWIDGFAQYLCKTLRRSTVEQYVNKITASVADIIKTYPRSVYKNLPQSINWTTPGFLKEKEAPQKRMYLTTKEVVIITSSHTSDLYSAHDLYTQLIMVQIHTGMAYADLMVFDPHINIHTDISGNHYVKYSRVKTKTEALIPIDESAKKYIEAVNWNTAKKVGLKTYNNNLRKIGQRADVDNLTSHMGRHTFGVFKLIEGYSFESIKKMMGHTSITTTEQVYAEVTIEKILNEGVRTPLQKFI